GHTVIAGRLAGAFRNIGRDRIADDIVKTMTAAGYAVRENDPFTDKPSLVIGARETSPYVNRLRLLWQKMREPVIERFPKAPGTPRKIEGYLKRANDAYVTDAYHSLSIEGYRVTPDLIERVRGGRWNPEADEGDRDQRNAMAARGYWQAFQAVQKSLGKILKGENPGEVADADHGTWYRDLFAPSVTVGLLKPVDLAGYRNGQVYIRKSKHVPLNRDAVRDAMPAFFDLLREEPHSAVRVVLGHFIFVYIHPYMDGNGRVGRFLMNTMMASGGYPWTVIPVGDPNAYVNTLEKASVGEDIAPFADFLAGLVRKRLGGRAFAGGAESSARRRRLKLHRACSTIARGGNEAYEFLPKIPFSSWWSPSCSAATRVRARGQFPHHASSSGRGVARRRAQGATAARARNLLHPRSCGVGQTRSNDQARHPLRHHEQFSGHARLHPSTSISSAASSGSVASRSSRTPRSGLRFDHPRWLPPVVRHENLLGCHTRRQKDLCR